MGFDGLKGRAKEAAGRFTGNRALVREGKTDQMADKVKRTVDKVKYALTGRTHRRPR
ncbi:MAG: CsbD family protein [Egibacteraceae bacterium]